MLTFTLWFSLFSFLQLFPLTEGKTNKSHPNPKPFLPSQNPTTFIPLLNPPNHQTAPKQEVQQEETPENQNQSYCCFHLVYRSLPWEVSNSRCCQRCFRSHHGKKVYHQHLGRRCAFRFWLEPNFDIFSGYFSFVLNVCLEELLSGFKTVIIKQ